MTRDKRWSIKLADGREVTVGAGVDEDPGVWLLHSDPLLRWLTAEDARKIAGRLLAAADHFEANPPHTRKRRK